LFPKEERRERTQYISHYLHRTLLLRYNFVIKPRPTISVYNLGIPNCHPFLKSSPISRFYSRVRAKARVPISGAHYLRLPTVPQCIRLTTPNPISISLLRTLQPWTFSLEHPFPKRKINWTTQIYTPFIFMTSIKPHKIIFQSSSSNPSNKGN